MTWDLKNCIEKMIKTHKELTILTILKSLKDLNFLEVIETLLSYVSESKAVAILIVIMSHNTINTSCSIDSIYRINDGNIEEEDYPITSIDIPMLVEYDKQMIQEILDDKNIYEFTGNERTKIIDPTNMYIVCKSMIPFPLRSKYIYMRKILDDVVNDLHIDYFNFVIAGGIFSYLMGIPESTEYFKSDIDLFIVADDEEEARENVIRFYEYVNRMNDFKIYMTENCMTIKYINSRFGFRADVQLVLRWHKKPEQVIEKFDQSPTMIYMYKGTVYYNAEGCFAFTHNCMIANIEKRRNNYSYRIKKYMDRNFGILMYDCELPREGEFTLDYVVYKITATEGNYLFCDLQKISREGLLYNYYSSDKIYDDEYLTNDNVQAGMYNVNSSNITGIVVDIENLIYTPIYMKIVSISANLVRDMRNKKILTQEEYAQLAMLLYERNHRGAKELLVRIFTKALANLKETYQASLKYYNDPIYEAKCPLDPCASSFYGEYYKLDNKLIMSD